MTPEQFIAIWKNNPLTERAGAQGRTGECVQRYPADITPILINPPAIGVG